MCAVSLFQRLFLYFGSVVIIVRDISSGQVLCLHWSGEIWVKCSSTQTIFGLHKLLWWSLLLHSIIIELSFWPSAGFLLPRSMFLIGITGKMSRSKQIALTQLKLLHGKHARSFNANPSLSLRSSCLQTKQQLSYCSLLDIFTDSVL